MHVGLTTTSLDPTWGGAQRYAAELALALADIDVDITVFITGDSRSIESARHGRIAVRALHYGRIRFLPASSIIQSAVRSFETTKQVASLKRESKIELIHDVDLGNSRGDVASIQQCSPASIVASIRARKPFWAEDWKQFLVSFATRQPILYPLQEYVLARKYKLVVAPSELVRDAFKRYYGIGGDKLKCLPHGVNTQRFSPDETNRFQLRQGLGIRDDEHLITFVGWDLTRKGLFLLLKAMPHIRKTKLLILGRKSLPDHYVHLSHRLGVLGRITTMSTPDIARFYQASDVFVFPTLFDAFGLVVLEAMACGVPVVSSPAAGASELITDGVDGVVARDIFNPKTLAAEISGLLNDDRLRRKMALNARQKSLEFDWKIMAKKMRGFYEEISVPPSREPS
ncbi:MAG: glycosyltransferase family 4 protein [Nitrososphaerales archaeon]|nr:glycosyltransferase family 4 protein [Nitrososphaerales archaeon]